ncbi:type II toxin-antitoxin system prevent-host-death family antitoxin [Salinarimonas sp.]|uniref:type II toxin-antitoxin system prevent-host-death family antitoxin n=1 Tax=Salinarimonas sp. TaxID=2766526 RepID=UPI0032D9A2A9
MTARKEVRISAAEVSRNFGAAQEQAQDAPVVVTHHGKPRVALLDYAEYERLREAGRPPLQGGDAEALRRKLRLLLDAIAEGYVSLDAEWRIVTVNRVAEFYFGRDRAEVEGRVLWDVFPAAAGGRVAHELGRAMKGGEVVAFEASSPTFPERLVDVRAYPLPLPEGGIAILFSNATERRRLTEALAKSESRLRALLSGMVDTAVVGFDAAGVVNSWSPGAEALFGTTEAEMLGRSIEAIHTPEERARGAQWAAMARARGDGVIELAGDYAAADGSRVPASGRLIAVADGPGGAFLMVIRRRDGD